MSRSKTQLVIHRISLAVLVAMNHSSLVGSAEPPRHLEVPATNPALVASFANQVTSGIASNDSDEGTVTFWPLTFEESIRLGLANNKEVSVITPIPSIASSVVSIERGEFDPVAGISTFGGEDDRQVRSEIATFGAPVDFQNIDYFRPFIGRNQAYLRQRLATGGTYEIGYGTNYLRFVPDAPELILPSGWESALNFEFSQPLFRGRGRVAAQRRLRVASARARQSEFEFRVKLRMIVRDIDLAYWRLAAMTRKADTAQSYIGMAEQFVAQESARAELGESARPDVLQVESILNAFRVDWARALRDRAVAEMKLRTQLGLAQLLYQDAQDGWNVAPILYQPIRPAYAEIDLVRLDDLRGDIAQAMTRPELGQAAAQTDEARANLAAARNKLLPDVSAHVLYSKTGLEKGLDDSVSTIFDDDFHTWGAGITYERRLRQRSEQAEVRQFTFMLAQRQARQNEIAHQIVGQLRQTAALIEGSQRLLEQSRLYVEVLSTQQRAFDELHKDGKISLFQRLDNVRDLQAAELQMQDNWDDLTESLALYRFERGDDAGLYGVEIDACSMCDLSNQ